MKKENLEKRVQHLEEKVGRLITYLADPDKYEFLYLCLETDLSDAQVDAILDLMDEVRETLKTKSPMNHIKFEGRVYDIVPSHKGDYHFAESIVRTLYEEGRYVDVYEHMKKDGMNI